MVSRKNVSRVGEKVKAYRWHAWFVRQIALPTQFFVSSAARGRITLAKISGKMISTSFPKFLVAMCAQNVVLTNTISLISRNHCKDCS
jgi:hypothetical protein